MANEIIKNNKFSFTPKIQDIKIEKSSILKYLPSVHQTDTLQKLFGTSADHLFDSGNIKQINGYIGQIPEWYNPQQDIYVKEIDKSRQFYQLEPTMVSTDKNTGEIQDVLFYTDFIDKLRFYGGIVDNQNRLFNTSFYTWCPPINLDKFINFREYYWLENGPNPFIVIGPKSTYKGNNITTGFSLPGFKQVYDTNIPVANNAEILENYEFYYDPYTIDGNNIKVFVDKNEYSFNSSSTIIPLTFQYDMNIKSVIITPTPSYESEIEIYVSTDIDQYLIGKTQVSSDVLGGILVSNDNRIHVTNDINNYYNGKTFIINGVGKSIELINDVSTPFTNDKDYIVMERGCVDANPWSKNNRWFHIDSITDISDETLKSYQARRPIIEFNKDLELFNYGTKRREDVYVVSENISDIYLNILGAESVIIDGVLIDQNIISDNGGFIRILVLNEVNDLLTNRVYRLTFDTSIQISIEADGEDPSGSPFFGEILYVKHGLMYSNIELVFNGVSWVIGQQKNTVNQPPLFNLYDIDHNFIGDESFYPNNNFNGNKIFGYKINDNGSLDSELDMRLEYDNNGQIVFENYICSLTYSYTQDYITTIPINGNYNFRYTSSDTFENTWYNTEKISKQYFVDQFTYDGTSRLFKLTDAPIDNDVDNLKVYRNRENDNNEIVTTLLVSNVDYIRLNDEIIIDGLIENDTILVEIYNPKSNVRNKNYQIPIGLSHNAKNSDVTTFTRGDIFSHFSEIIRNQNGFSGKEYNVNNYRNTDREVNLGTKIIQNDYSLLKTMLLCSNDDIDVIKSIRYSESEYNKFKFKFEQKLNDMLIKDQLSYNDSYDTWIDIILDEINKNKDKSSPFFYSEVGKTNIFDGRYFIPATPAYLGITPCVEPTIYSDSKNNDITFIVGHDGSKVPVYGDVRDNVILSLETRIYQSIKNNIRNRQVPYCNKLSIVDNFFKTNDYTREEYNKIIVSSLEKWCVQYGLNYKENTTYDPNDIWTWNWSSVVSNPLWRDWVSDTQYFKNMIVRYNETFYMAIVDNSSSTFEIENWIEVSEPSQQYLPGHWRGIYNYLYGTDRPNTHPWEMLGLSRKPSWWDNRYGPAPYTKENTILWNDIERGYIHSGENKGINENISRPGIRYYIPVDSNGSLLDPIKLGIASSYPEVSLAQSDWKVGDYGPIEYSWINTSYYQYAVSVALFLMSPSKFIETTWNSENYTKIYNGINSQFVNIQYGKRINPEDEYVFGEEINDQVVVNIGVQQFVSDYLKSKNKDIKSYFGDKIRGLDSKLSYKVSGFIDSSSTNILTDSFGSIPDENIHVQLYKSPSKRESFYSGVVIEKVSNGYKVSGYDILNPSFTILEPNKFGKKKNISITSRNNVTITEWRSNQYYSINSIVIYRGLYYRALRTHTSSNSFEIDFWLNIDKPEFLNISQFMWYKESTGHKLSINYGTVLKTLQDVCNFLCGLELYQKNDGWVFENVDDQTNNTYDWLYSCQQFLTWVDTTPLNNEFIALSPLSNYAKFKTEFGAVQPVEQFVNGVYPIQNRYGLPIDSKDTFITRYDDYMEIESENSDMYGIRVYVSEYEHIIVFDNETIFNDIIYDQLLNIRQPRLRLNGFKSSNWNGRIDAPGYVISDNILLPNFQTTADSFRQLFSSKVSNIPLLQDRARSNIGFEEKDYLNNLLITKNNQFEFYKGMIQQKGTSSAFNKILRSNFIRHNREIQFLEEWAFRIGDYGNSDIQKSFDITISQNDYRNNPQLISFEDNYTQISWTVNKQVTLVNGISTELFTLDNDVTINKIIVKIISASENNGVVSIGYNSQISNMAHNIPSEKAETYIIDNKQEISKNTTVFAKSTANDSCEVFVEFHYDIIPEMSSVDSTNGIVIKDLFDEDNKLVYKDSRWVYRHDKNNINFDVDYYEMMSPEFLPNAGYVNIDEIKWISVNSNEFISLYNDTLNNNIPKEIVKTISFNYNISYGVPSIRRNTLIASKKSGYFRVVSIVVDISETFLPNTSKLRIGTNYNPSLFVELTPSQLTNIDTYNFYPYTLMDNLVSDNSIIVEFEQLNVDTSNINLGKLSVEVKVEWITDSILPGDRVWLYDRGNGDWMTYKLSDTKTHVVATFKPTKEGQSTIIASSDVISNLTENDLVILDGVQDTVPDINGIFYPRFNNQIKTLIDGKSNQVFLLDLLENPGMVIDKISINVLQEFVGGGSAPSITIGTFSNPTRYAKYYQPSNQFVEYNPEANVPIFEYGRPIYIDIPNTDITVDNSQSTVPIYVVRGGNIFLTPSSVTVTNPGSGYTSAPTVLVTGPEGVEAVPVLSGKVDRILVTNGGRDYTSPPEVTVIGDGSGCTALATINDGKIISIDIVSPGRDFSSEPTIIISGGGGYGAEAVAVMNYGVNSITLTATGKCNYTGSTPSTVSITGGGGSGATAVVNYEPESLEISSFWYRYKRNSPDETSWSIPQRVDFSTASNPGLTGKDHWLSTIEMNIDINLDTDSIYQFQILNGSETDLVNPEQYSPINAVLNNRTSIINVKNTSIDDVNIDLTQIGTTVLNGDSVNEDDKLFAFIDSNENIGSAIIVVDYHLTSGFEILDIDRDIVSTTVDGFGGNILSWSKTRYKNLSDINDIPGGWNDGDIVEIDGDNLWSVYRFDNGQWTNIRSQNKQTNQRLLTNGELYSKTTGQLLQILQVFDPYKGLIPGIIEQNIDFKLEYDPAIYNQTNDTSITYDVNKSWGSNQVGLIWWDLSTTRYINYEIDSIDYRWRNWGKICPKTDVNIYEWVRSTVPPSEWNDLVTESKDLLLDDNGWKPTGIIDDPENHSWVERVEWSEEIQKDSIFYYFWVRNTQTIPSNRSRSLSAQQISNQIKNPQNDNIPFISFIDRNSILIGGINDYINSDDLILKVKWNTDIDSNIHHKQWILQRENDNIVKTDNQLWSNMRNSLTGFDLITMSKNHEVVLLSDVLINSTTAIVDNGELLTPYGELVTKDNRSFTYTWKWNNTLYGVKSTNVSPILSNQSLQQRITSDVMVRIPDRSLTEYEANGNLTFPKQTWFPLHKDNTNYITNKDSRKILIETINDIFSREPIIDTLYDWRDIFETYDPYPNDVEYNFKVDNINLRNQYSLLGLISYNQTILVISDNTAFGFWTLWKYQPFNPSSDQYGYVLVKSQRYRLQDGELWDKIDWYKSGWSSDNYPNYIFDTTAQRDKAANIDVSLLRGTLVQVNNISINDNRWSWSVLTDTGWEEVAREKATIKLRDNFFDSDYLEYGIDNFIISDIPKRDGSFELRVILNGLYDILSPDLINEIFFEMVRTSIRLNNQVDWVFKTSFLYLGGYSEKLRQNPISSDDVIQNILEYIEDVKPYHVKIRDYIRRVSYGPDIANITITDFDFPLYKDDSLNNGQGGYRKLDPFNSFADLQIVQNNTPWSDWWNNYQNTNTDINSWDQNWNPIRKNNIQILFDRVSCESISGFDSTGFDSDILYNNSNELLSLEYLSDKYRNNIKGIIKNYDVIEYDTDIFGIDNDTIEFNPYKDSSVYDYFERNELLRTNQIVVGTICYISLDNTYWMWNGTEWIMFENIGFDGESFGGLADRIEDFYEPRQNMKPKIMCDLINGCSFKYTRNEGFDFSDELFDAFPFDQSGYANEFNFYIGNDVEIIGRDFPSVDRANGQRGEQSLPETYDSDGNANVSSILPDGSIDNVLSYEDILINGGSFSQPSINEDRPEERAGILSRNPFMLTIYQQSGGSLSYPIAHRMFKSANNIWEFYHINNDDITLVGDLSYISQEITIDSPSGMVLHDPNNPSSEFLDKIKLNMIDMNMSQSEINAILSRRIPGAIWIDHELIYYSNIEQISSTSFKLTGLIRSVGGTSRSPLINYYDRLYASDGTTTQYAVPPQWISGTNSFNEIKVQVLEYRTVVTQTGSFIAAGTWVNKIYGEDYTISGNNIIFNGNKIPEASKTISFSITDLDSFGNVMTLASFTPEQANNSKKNIKISFVMNNYNNDNVSHYDGTYIFDASPLTFMYFNNENLSNYPYNIRKEDLIYMRTRWLQDSKEGPTQ